MASSCFLVHARRFSQLAEQQLKHTRLFNPKITPPRQAWVETFIDREKQLLGIVDLHPRVFSVFPRIDYVSEMVKWQKSYRDINYVSMPTRAELPGGTQRPWPLKGTGRARHKSVNSPIFLKGGWTHGPRGPTTQFKLQPFHRLTNALTSMLTIKLAQDDLKIVDTIEGIIPEDSEELEKNFADRKWGPSVLIVDKCTIFPDHLWQATKALNHVNLMPTTGLNALSMCKHETMVMTLAALRDVEEKLLHQLVRVDLVNTRLRYRD